VRGVSTRARAGRRRASRVIAVFANELRLLLRDRGAAAWLLLGPILFITVFSAARYQSSKRPPLLVPVVDDDQGPVARTFVKLLREHADVLETSRTEAEAMVRDRGTAAAAVVFPEGLSKRYLQGRNSEVLLLTDPAEGVGVNRVKVALLLTSRDAAEIADPVGVPRIQTRETNLTGDRISRRSHEQNVPGFAVMFTLLSVVYATAAGLQVEAGSGVVDRLLVAPVGFTRVLLAKAAARVLGGTVQLLALLAWGALVFGISLGSSPTAVVLLVVATAFAAVGMGALAAGLARSLEQALPIALALVLPVAAIGGLWWPIHVEPAWMRAIADWTPSRWAMSGLVDLVLRDRGLDAVLYPVAVLVAQGALLLAVGLRLFRGRFATR